MGEANAELTSDRRILLRIGINLGDVMVEGGDLYGEGVNIAARLQSLAGGWRGLAVPDRRSITSATRSSCSSRTSVSRR
jgi:class 3 adenylate cyclase